MPNSIRDLAHSLGVSPSTVSRALKGTGRISPELRASIRKAAQKAGYHSHPLISQAFSLARQPQEKRYRETLAAIAEFDIKTGPDYQKLMLAGAQEQASRLAYKMETFVLSGKPAQHKQLSRVLWNRGIRGLIILPRTVSNLARIHLDWNQFTAVEIGRTLWHPRNLHRLETPQYPKTIEIIHLLKKVGYKRIGMAVEPAHNKRLNGVYYAAYMVMQQTLPEKSRLPIPGLSGKWDLSTFSQWFRKYKPDVLIAHDVASVHTWLQKLGLSIPDDVSIFRLGMREDDPTEQLRKYDWTGILPDQKDQGSKAVDMVTLLLERGITGPVGNPMCWQVDGSWRAGKTLSKPINDYLTPEGYLHSTARRQLTLQ